MAAQFKFSIELPVRNEWQNVDLLRSSVQNCFSAVFRDIDGCHTVAMITGELLENAIKYGDWSHEPSLFLLRVWGDQKEAHVQVENPVKPDSPEVRELLETLEWMKGFASAEEAYRARLLQIAEKPPSEGLSKLGLVRMGYEGNCKLTAEVTPGSTLRMTAEVRL